MKVGIVGSRRRNTQEDKEKIKFEINVCDHMTEADVEIITGGCYCGADKFAEELSKEYSYDITIRRPKYYKHGKKATFVRNDLIAKESEVLIACVSDDRTGGTEDTIIKFMRYHPEGKLILC